MTSKWKKLDSKYILENPWYKVRQDKVISPDGKQGEYNVVECGLSVFVVPVTADGKIMLIKLFRYTTQHEGWEVPAGGVELSEKPLTAAKRELQEESGFTAGTWKELGHFDSMNGMTNAEAYVFEAKDLVSTNLHAQEEEGIIKVKAFTPQEILNMIQNGEIVDALSIAALVYVFNKYAMLKASLI